MATNLTGRFTPVS